jgi:hypothetical protein
MNIATAALRCWTSRRRRHDGPAASRPTVKITIYGWSISLVYSTGADKGPSASVGA